MKLKLILAGVCALMGWHAGAQTYNWATIAGSANTSGYADGTNGAALFNSPQGVAVDGAGNIFVADANNYVIRKLSRIGTNWVTTTIAGLAGSSGFVDGVGNAAKFYNLSSLKIDGVGNLYVQDYNVGAPYFGIFFIRRISPVGTNWVVTTIYRLPSNGNGWATDASGNFFTSTNFTIIQVSPVLVNGTPSLTNFTTTALAGSPGLSGSIDGTNSTARFSSPSVFGVDSTGNIYLADQNYATGYWPIRKVTPISNNYVTTTLNLLPPSNSLPSFAFKDLDRAGNIFGSPWSYTDILNGTNFSTHIFHWQPGTANGVAFGGLRSITTLAGVAAGADGTVYFADSGASVIRQAMPVSPSLGGLQVTLPSPGAVEAGAAWRVDAGGWQTTGVTVTNLIVGSNHILSFMPVYGWVSPSNQWVTISNNATSKLIGNYFQQSGSLQVIITPPDAITGGAQWALDGGSWQTGGTTISNLTVGTHTVAFTNIAGFITPFTQTNVLIVPNQTTLVAVNYLALGAVSVIINPTNAATGGAQWALDAGGWQNSGVILSNLALGTHTISYLPLNSWTAPSNRVVNVVSGLTTNVTATYTALGSLQVFIAPIGAVSVGAAWQVDNDAWQLNGALVTNLVAGSHTVVFTNIIGWATPSNLTLAVTFNQITVATGVYLPQLGSLQIVLSPAGAVSEGAQWQVDAGAWQASGATLTNLIVGNHAIAYAHIPGWTEPTNQPVTINLNQTTRRSAIYQGQGSLQVMLLPAGAILSGAQWQVDGGAWMSNGVVLSGLTRGIHTIGYKPVTGWLTPANQSVNIFANQTLVTNGLYSGLDYEFTTIAGTIGTNAYADGVNFAAWFSTPVGICADTSSNLYIADTGNSVIRKLTPTTNGWVSSTLAGLAGYSGSADGTNSQARFNYPSGVAVDANGALYVADQVNSTVRKMTFDGTNWTVSTIAGLAGNYGNANGTNSLARFYYPAGVAVDSVGNVYVADQINCAIRKLTPLGSNTWTVSTIAGAAGLNGSADGPNSTARFYWPTDLKVDPTGTVFVADTFNHTIRQISLIGTNYITTTICGLAGVNNSVDGTNNTALFDGPGGLALDAFGNLFVADSYSSVLRKITPMGTNWVVKTIGGLAYVIGATDGLNALARFDAPSGIIVGGNGVVYVVDTYNQTIRAGFTASPLPAPLDIMNVPAVTNFSFSWQGQSGLKYQVQIKTNLVQTAWVDVGSKILGTDARMMFIDTATTNNQRFYRLMVLP